MWLQCLLSPVSCRAPVLNLRDLALMLQKQMLSCGGRMLYQIHMAQNVSAMNQEIARLLNVFPQFTS